MSLDKEKLEQIERIVDEHFDDQWEDGYTRTSRKSADAMALAVYLLGAQAARPEEQRKWVDRGGKWHDADYVFMSGGRFTKRGVYILDDSGNYLSLDIPLPQGERS